MKSKLFLLAVFTAMFSVNLFSQEDAIIYTDFEPDSLIAPILSEYEGGNPPIDINHDGIGDFMFYKYASSAAYMLYMGVSDNWQVAYAHSQDSLGPIQNYIYWSRWRIFIENVSGYDNKKYAFRYLVEDVGYYYGWVRFSFVRLPGPHFANYEVTLEDMAFCTIPDYPLRFGQKSLLTSNPEEINLFDEPEGGEETLTITNNNTFDIVMNDINFIVEAPWGEDVFDAEYDFSLPYTITAGESVDIEVSFVNQFREDIEIKADLIIETSVGEHTVPVSWVGGVGLEENELFTAKIYPNPAENTISLRLAEGAVCKDVKIYSIDGRLLKHQSKVFDDIDISNLSSGMYIAEITLKDGNVFTEKIAVK